MDALTDRLAGLSPEKRVLLEALLRKKRLEAASSAVIPPRDVPGPFPLSFSQERLWLVHQLDPGSPAYNVPTVLRFTGELSVEALREGLAAVTRRHEALRARFDLRDGHPVQEIEPEVRVDLPRVDLAGLPAEEREAEAGRLAREEALGPFDLRRGPLCRATVVQLSGRDHLLLLTLHHIVSDAWSTGIFARELGAFYAAALAGRPAVLPELPIQYPDFALWQRRTLSGQELERRLEFWRSALAGLDPVLELPADRLRPARRTPRGGFLPLTLPAPLTRGLKDLTGRAGATLFVTLLSGFFTLLHRLTYRTDLCAGTPVAGRDRVETEGLIGFFVDTLVVRADVSGDPAFRALLERVRELVLDAQSHGGLPFERLVAELVPERSLSHAPVFQVLFAFQNAPLPALELPGLAVRGVELPLQTTKFDLTLVLWEEEGRIAGGLEYSLDLFERATAQRYADHLAALFEGIAADAERPVSDLPLLSAAERHQLLLEWGGLRWEPSPRETLHGRFEAQAARTPEAPAVACGGETLSYGELNRRANRLAGRLRDLGVGPDSRVGLRLERSAALVVGLLGILKAGGAYVPLDPQYPQERLDYMIEDAGIRVVVDAGMLLDLDTPDRNPEPLADGSSLAYVIYTSGSTGRPKGALVSHANVSRLFDATRPWFGFGEGDVWTLFHSYAFDFSVWEVWGALLYGGRVVVVPYEVSRSPEAFLDLLVGERVTVLNQTPSAFAQLARVDEERGGVRTALRWVIFGGEALDLPSLAPWFARHGDQAPTLVNMYGITETTVHVTYRPLKAADAAGERRSVIGVPIPDLGLYVLDPWMRPAPVGVPGELAVGGAGLARGYLGRPELTASRFVPDPVGGRPGARLYRSGDLGRFLPNGDIEYLGRIDHQVKIRGFRIELGEIQAALEEQPGVRQAVVLPREEASGDRRLLAFVVADPERPPAVGELRSALGQRLPDYMVPAGFVMLESLPLTQNGKVDRKALLAAAVPVRDSEIDYAPPRDAAERALAEIWQEVLGVERVGIDDRFFSLGGDSILSIRVRALAEAKGLRFSLYQLFEHQTVRELAGSLRAGLRAAEEEPASPEPSALLRPEDRERLPQDAEDAYPPSLLQLGMLFHSEREPGSMAYHNVSSFLLRGPFDAAALAAAVERLAARHPVLRTSFDSSRYSEPLQIVHRGARISLETADLRGFELAERERVVAERFEEEKRRRFDWSQPGLLRFWAHALTADTFELGMTEHHAILDGWSFSTLLAELFGLYFAELGAGAPLPPPPPATVVRDFVALERAAVESAESRHFWSETLAGHTFLELPRWPAVSGAGIHKRTTELPAEIDAALGRFAEAAGVPVKSALLAVHARVLECLGGSPDVMTGLVSNGRPEVEGGERALGLFLNTLPLRLRLPGGTWTDLVRAVFAAELETLPHRRFPLAELQRRFSGGGPLFEVTFNYTHFHVLENAAGIELLSANLLAETHFALAVHFSRGLGSGALLLELQYDSAQLHSAQVQAYADLYARFLAALARDPGQSWTAAPPLSAAERHQALSEWNDTRATLPAVCLHELFEIQADRSPDATAVVAEEGSLTYGELERRANQLAHRLRSLGVGPDVLVGLCAERSPEMVVGMLAVLKAGGAYVPLDPEYPKDRLAYLLEDSGAAVLLTQRRLAAEIPSGDARAILLEDEPAGAAGADDTDGRLSGGAGPDNLAYVIYTSGSTGRPKGVLVRHGGVVNRLLWAQRAYPVTAADRVLQKASFSFDFSVWECFGPLIAGAQLVLARPGGQRDAAYLVRTIRGREITLVHFIPSMLQAFLAEDGLEECASLRYVFSGGEALSLELQERCLARVPAPLRNQYGPTEISIDTTDWVCGPRDSERGFVPLGRPLSNTAIHILDERLQPVPPGVAGELFVGGAGVARGYWRRPELTAEKFLPDPFSETPGARLYRTGDRAQRLPDGNLRFLGRADHQVKIRGYRIEPGEIEAALLRHPRVREAVVVPREKAGDLRLVAYLVPRAETPVDGELRELLAGSLPDYLIPAAFVALPALPLSPNGKLDRAALPEPGQAAGPQRDIDPPRDEVELRLAQLWEDLLDVRPVGIRDDFFALGGHSLLALRALGGIERLFGRRVSLSALLETPTIERLAGLLRQDAAAPPRSVVVPIQPRGDRPPLFLFHPVGGNVLCYLPLARVLDGPVYGIQSPGLEDLPAPWTIESLAAHYLAAIREIQPAGPWRLAGWSMGGLLAYEVARQLGREAAMLVMIDVAPPGEGGGGEEDPRLAMAQFVYDLRGLAGLRTPPEWPAEIPATLDALLEREEVRAALPPDVGPDRVRELFEVFRANRQALRLYRPGPWPGRIVLVRAEATVAADTSAAFQAWADLAGEGAEVHVLPGDHYSLPRNPGLAGLLAALISP